jgi:hypothetical protein
MLRPGLLTFDSLLKTLTRIEIQYYCLNYAALRLDAYLREEYAKDLIHDFEVIVSNQGKGSIFFLREELFPRVQHLGHIFNISESENYQALLIENSQFIRNKIINLFLEAIYNFDSHNKSKQIVSKLNHLPWFMVLTALRNISSHNFDAIKIQWNKHWPDPLVWKTIEIKKGQLGSEVRYNDIEIRNLLETAIGYLEENYKLFS